MYKYTQQFKIRNITVDCHSFVLLMNVQKKQNLMYKCNKSTSIVTAVVAVGSICPFIPLHQLLSVMFSDPTILKSQTKIHSIFLLQFLH